MFADSHKTRVDDATQLSKLTVLFAVCKLFLAHAHLLVAAN